MASPKSGSVAWWATMTWLTAVAVSQAGEVTLNCTADNSICSHWRERTYNMGASRRIKCKGLENFLLLDFDTVPIKNRSVARATLYLKSAIPNPMFRKVGVSTVATPWTEGRRVQQDPATQGESNFLSPEVGKRTWAGPGTDFTYVSFGNGGTFWRRVYLGRPEGGWFKIPVDPRIVESMAQGMSFGMAVSDDNGEVMYIHPDVYPNTCHDNNYFHSRETGPNGPRLVVTLEGDVDTAPPGAVRDLRVEARPRAATFERGAARITWTASGDDGEVGRALGYLASVRVDSGAARPLPRWRIPIPPEAGRPVDLLLDGLPPNARISIEVAAVDEGGKRSKPVAANGRASAARSRPPRLKPVLLEEGEGAEPPVRDGKMRVWAFGDCLKVNPISGNLLEEKGVVYAGPAAGTYRAANAVWNGATGTISLRGARGEWVAFQLAVEAVNEPAPRLTGVEVKLARFIGPGAGKGRLAMEHASIGRAWYIKSGEAWYADPLVPLAGTFDIPWDKNGVTGQRAQALYLEFFVPRRAEPGIYRGAVKVRADGVEEFSLPVELSVLPFTIPEEVHFVWSMNGYGSPGRHWGRPTDAGYLAAERDFYVKSHVHRTCLAALHYSHSGRLYDEAAPPITGRGKDARVADWSAFDRRFGPLFDGSAFKGTPREGVPLDHFYLTFHENWPAPMAGGYKWNVPKFEDHWTVCGPPGEGFSREYQETWKAVLADFARHVRRKGWTRTRFMVFLNNKFRYKRYDGEKKRRGRGTSFWSLDEPHFADDYLALAFFARMTRQALGGRHGNIVFRADISVPQWQRDTLDGLLDLNVCGGHWPNRRKVEERRDRYGETLWTYGHLARVNASALELQARALRAYTQTLDGFVPWLTLGSVRAWRTPTPTIAFYPGKPVGIDGCVPSLRLKACRRGQQDVEYLWLLGRRLGLDRRQAAELGAVTLRLSASFRQAPDTGAKSEKFTGLTYGDFEHFRRAVAAELARRK